MARFGPQQRGDSSRAKVSFEEAGVSGAMDQRSPRIRWFVVFLLAVVWMGAIFARVTYLQLFRYSEYLSKAQRQQQRIRETRPKRGSIYDRNGHELAVSLPVDYCFADHSEVSDASMVAQLLSRILNQSPDDIEAKLADPHPFPVIAHKLTPEIADRIEALNLRGIYVQKEPVRVYPQRFLASQVIGYVDVDENGLGGIESSLDKHIRGKPGRVLMTKNGKRHGVDRVEAASLPGASVTLTLDENIQYIAEKELAAAIADTHSIAGTVVVEDPNSGELLAIANWPTFDANEPSHYPDEDRMNRAVASAYEPGSTFKVITLASAFENGVAKPTDVVDCQMGSIQLAGRVIHDWHPFGLLSVAQILAHSSDVGSIKIALRVGAQNLYQTAHRFGIGQLTGIDLPGENHGLFRRVEDWSANSIGSIAIGQEVSVTPVQVATVISAIANGGVVYRPHVIKEVGAGSTVGLQQTANSDAAPRRAVDANVAATLRQLMEGVVLEGTGKPAQLNGYTDAGKSGTAQKIDPNTGRYSPDKYVTSFVGFAPVNEPALTIVVVLDSPVGAHHGGDVAGPVFRRIAEQALNYMNVPHDVPVAPSIQMAARRADNELSEPDARADAGNDAKTKNGKKSRARTSVADVAEAIGNDPAPSTPSAPTVQIGGEAGVTVPSLSGQSVRDVTEACSKLGLTPVLVGSGIALEQTPEAGAHVVRGSRIVVKFGRPGRIVPAASRGNSE
ncbi:MAG: penicillin-binding transpeptidase domain-containing protein [Candidatus Acidiferrales bacterium]|jgi:cell division protein FtsI (penicillin-binding protein 3)